MSSFLTGIQNEFIITIEVVPPEGGNPGLLLNELKAISTLPFHGFSIASNPIAKPRMSAMVFSYLLQNHTRKPAVLHCCIRDQNRTGMQALLWGARALKIDSILAMTGDRAKAGDVILNDPMDVFGLIRLSRDSGFHTGAVLDFRPEINGLKAEVRRLEQKKTAGADYIVTQPVYDTETAMAIHQAVKHLEIPVIMGILPLISIRHARFLHEKVAGISIPDYLIGRMEKAKSPLNEGIEQAKALLNISREWFSGACVMPPFNKFHILSKILEAP